MIKKIVIFFLFVTVLFSCSTKKNTFVNRGYHNLTARYNGYYYSCENINEGIFKIEKANKDNFDKVLPVFIYPSPEKAKSTFADFDKAIKKSSICIQRHAIKNEHGTEIATAGKWIDNNWLNIGISHFYKREFFSAIEAFEYVIRTYTKSNDKYTAMIWLMKAYNEVGSVSSSEPIISLLKNAKGLPKIVDREFPCVEADYYLRRGQNTEAIAKLMDAVRNNNLFFGNSQKKRARYSFITAQLLELAKDNKRALDYYKKTLQLKPNYEMQFYSRIKIARLVDLTNGNSDKTKKDLLKMAKEFKNSDYFDVIYYTLGEIEEKHKNINEAQSYYKKSVYTSTGNPKQKALSYLKLGEINFELTNYVPAEAYYDSAVVTLPKDHPDYKNIQARKKTLETLVSNLKIISAQDSLQRIAKMDDKARTLYVERLIDQMKVEEERKKRQAELSKTEEARLGSNNSGGTNLPGFGDIGAASFYFYNPNTLAIGISEFTKKWGQRKLEDNWNRASKALSIDEGNASETTEVKINEDSLKKLNALTKEQFLKNLPIGDSAIKASNKKIVKAYYTIGSIYKEELNNNKKTIHTYEELNTRFPDNKYTLNTYYSMYRIYLDEKNNAKAEYYKNKILNEYPDSEFALLIKNPEYAQERSLQKTEVEKFYNETYAAYSKEDFSTAFSKADEGVKSFSKSLFAPRFEFIKAMSKAKLKGTDSLENDLKLLVAKYPNAEITPLSNDILISIKKQKNPELFSNAEKGKINTDTFTINFDAQHFIIALTPDKSQVSQALITNLGNFNSTYYSDKKFDISSNIFGIANQIVILKTFDDAKSALSYFENLKNDPDIFKGEVKKEDIIILPIMADNLPLLYKKKNMDSYKLFFTDSYKALLMKN